MKTPPLTANQKCPVYDRLISIVSWNPPPGIPHAFLLPSLVVYALDRVDSSPGPVMGTFTAFTDLGISLGSVIMGIIIHTASYPIMFLCLALTSIINLNYFYFFVRKKG